MWLLFVILFLVLVSVIILFLHGRERAVYWGRWFCVPLSFPVIIICAYLILVTFFYFQCLELSVAGFGCGFLMMVTAVTAAPDHKRAVAVLSSIVSALIAWTFLREATLPGGRETTALPACLTSAGILLALCLLTLRGLWGECRGRVRLVVIAVAVSIPVISMWQVVEKCAYPKIGYIDKNGNWVIKPRFRFAREFSEGYASVSFVGDCSGTGDIYGAKWGLIDKTGRLVVKPVSDSSLTVKEGRAVVNLFRKRKNDWQNKCGYIDVTGKRITEAIFDHADDFSEGYAAVKIGEKHGYIRLDGSYLFEPVFEEAESFYDGLAVVKQNGLYGGLGTNGMFLVKPQYTNYIHFAEGLASVCIDGKWGCVDRNGKMVITNRFDDALSFRKGIAPVKVGAKWGLINRKGDFLSQSVLDGSFHLCSCCFDGTGIAVQKNSKYGFMNTNGVLYCEPKYQLAFHPREGMGNVRETLDGKWGYVDQSGNLVIPCMFDEYSNFSDGFACIRVGSKPAGKDLYYRIGGKYGYIDRTGKFVIPAKFEQASLFKNGHAEVLCGKKWGVIDKTGRFVIEPRFLWIGSLSDDLTPACVK